MLKKERSRGAGDRFSFIDEAYRSFKKKKYENAAIILEKAHSSGTSDPYAMFLLAVSLIYSNNFSRAGEILEHLQRVDPHYEHFIQLKSFLSLKSAVSREEAIHIYVSALEKIPADRMLRKALRILEDSGDFSRYQRNVKLDELVTIPQPGKRQKKQHSVLSKKSGIKKQKKFTIPGIVLIAVGLICVILFALSPIYYSSLVKKYSDGSVEDETSDISGKVDMVDLGGAGYGIVNRINSEKTPEFYASGDVVIKDFNEARRLLKKGEFNRGVIILNRIINSNSSYMVKEKCEFLIKYVMDSDERVHQEIDIVKLNNKPYLYRGSSVKLTGKVANVKKVKGGKSFTLIVGYDGSNLKGITLVFDPNAEPVKNGDIVEVCGLYITGIGKDNVPYISSDEITVK
ncbi:MAG TPA: CDC27 family protein [Spirochaetota bacterium]|nr:CDC27 family protein [Spirochaetota bacterium]HPJ33657.1 CDC27 family protein [Spirochaetota bacterium]